MSESTLVRWRGPLSDAELAELEVAPGDGESNRWDRICTHSLGWVTARTDDGTLVGFLNVAWDGGAHAFLLDTTTRDSHQRRGVATKLVEVAVHEAERAGCEWVHVDFPEDLGPFYFDACGFQPTPAGLIHLPNPGGLRG